jgi:hypothetical protein
MSYAEKIPLNTRVMAPWAMFCTGALSWSLRVVSSRRRHDLHRIHSTGDDNRTLQFHRFHNLSGEPRDARMVVTEA